MAKLNQLSKITTKSKKRVGRGYGSGKGGHTAGRGAKGQKARSKVKAGFAGTKTRKSLLKRLPLLRGKDKLKARKPKPIIVNLKYLNLLPKDAKVTLESLDQHGVISQVEGKKFGVKILGEGKIEKSLVISLPVSQGARKKIEQAGGKVVINDQGKGTAK